MPYPFPPELSQLVESQMALGQYQSEDELLVDAMHALDDIRRQREQLRSEIRTRLQKAGKVDSQPLNREAFTAEARRRLSNTTRL